MVGVGTALHLDLVDLSVGSHDTASVNERNVPRTQGCPKLPECCHLKYI